MTKRQRKAQDKNAIRDTMTNKKISPNKEVVCVENAVDYVKKQGYLVLRPKIIDNIRYSIFALLMIMLLAINMSNVSSATLTAQNISGDYPDLIFKTGSNVLATLKLVENTCDSPVHCYAIINISNNIIAPLPDSFDTIDRKGNIKNSYFKVSFLNTSNITYIVPHKYLNCSFVSVFSGGACRYINDYNTTTKKPLNQYQDYNGQSFPVGNHTLKIEARVQPNSEIDWGTVFNGIDIRDYWAWWNTTYLYKKQINVSGIVLRNDVINFTFTRPSGMEINYSDLRFINSTETGELSFYIENYSSVQATVYVKLESNASFYMYYGKTGLNNQSNYYSIWRNITSPVITWTYDGASGGIGDGGRLSTNRSLLIKRVNTASGSNSINNITIKMGSAFSTAINIYPNNFTQSNHVATLPTAQYLISATDYWLNAFDGAGNKGYNSNPASLTPPYVRDGLSWTRGNVGATEYSQYFCNIDSIEVANYSLANVVMGNEETQTSSTTITINFLSQTPNDLTSSNVNGGLLNIKYNVTTSNNTASINKNISYIFIKTNSSINQNPFYINGSLRNVDINGFYQSTKQSTNISINYTFSLGDNDILGGTYNFQPDIVEETPHSFITLGSNGVLKIQFLNISSITTYNYIEIMTNKSGTGEALSSYYCNSTYSTGNPATNNNCGLYYTLPITSTFNHSEGSYSKHQILPFAIINNSISGVKVTSTSYMVFTGNNWNMYYINNLSRTGAISTSNNNGGSYSNQVFTIDGHIHQFSNDTFNYYACFNDTSNIGSCSSVRSDAIGQDNLPPTSPQVYSPNSTQPYSDMIDINYTQSFSPNGYSILFYNISLLNNDFSFNTTIISNNSLNLGYSFNSTIFDDGQYIIKVEVKDINGLTSFGYSEPFIIDNTQETPTVIHDVLFSLDMTTLIGIAIFIIALLIAVATLVFINWNLGAIFILLCGVLALVSIENKLIALFLIIIGVILIMMKER